LSDIDILFLYPDKGSLGAMKRLNEALLYLLWGYRVHGRA
jgi:UTP:GlnB (protein PII) uridylyltransferase